MITIMARSPVEIYDEEKDTLCGSTQGVKMNGGNPRKDQDHKYDVSLASGKSRYGQRHVMLRPGLMSP